MKPRVYYAAEVSDALDFALDYLRKTGREVTNVPSTAVTDVLLGVPCRVSSEKLKAALATLPPAVRIFGGFLERKELQGYPCYDLLTNEAYLAKNAAITAHCAVQLAAQRLPVILADCPVLVLGWGRIGKVLTKLLKDAGAHVTVGVRSEEQRAMLDALGYTPTALPLQEYILPQFRVIFNTIPAPVLSAEALAHCQPGCVKLELASEDGIVGNDVLIARGLPGKIAPESSGQLIAHTVIGLNAIKEDGV